MKLISRISRYAVALVLSGILAAGPVMADKGGGKGGKHDRGDHRNERRDDGGRSKGDGDQDRHSSASNRHFDERQHVMVREYYVEHYRGRRCPPGLAKKNNGCLPPGQAKKWRIGRPLPREVIYYSVPQALVVQIGLPPAGHRYVRVAGDILLIAIGTGMVIDAINDLGGM